MATHSPFLRREDGFIVGMRLEYLSGVEVIALFNWNALSEDEAVNIADDFMVKVRSSMMGGNLHRDGTPIPMLPSTFKLNLIEVKFSPKSVLQVLRIFGLGEELFSVDAAPGSNTHE